MSRQLNAVRAKADQLILGLNDELARLRRGAETRGRAIYGRAERRYESVSPSVQALAAAALQGRLPQAAGEMVVKSLTQGAPRHAPPQRSGHSPPPPRRDRRPGAVVPMPRPLEQINAGIRSAADAIALGYADEFSAGADALTGFGGPGGLRQRYENNLAAEHERDAYYSSTYPGTWAGGQVAGTVGSLLAAGLGRVPVSISKQMLPRSAVRAAETTRKVPFIRQGYDTMGAVGGGVIGAGSQLVEDASRGELSKPQDVALATLGGAIGGVGAVRGRPVVGGGLGAGLTAGGRDLADGGDFSVDGLRRAIQAGAYSGRLLNFGGKYASNAADAKTKGAMGEGLGYLKALARGEGIPRVSRASASATRRIPGLEGGMIGPQRTITLQNGRKTVADWVTEWDRAIENKFGAYARLERAQRLAPAELGDAYVVDHWLPRHVGELNAGWLSPVLPTFVSSDSEPDEWPSWRE